MNLKVVYPHSFRHRFAKNFLEKRKDIALLADLMGHESIETTRIYLRKIDNRIIDSDYLLSKFYFFFLLLFFFLVLLFLLDGFLDDFFFFPFLANTIERTIINTKTITIAIIIPIVIPMFSELK